MPKPKELIEVRFNVTRKELKRMLYGIERGAETLDWYASDQENSGYDYSDKDAKDSRRGVKGLEAIAAKLEPFEPKPRTEANSNA